MSIYLILSMADESTLLVAFCQQAFSHAPWIVLGSFIGLFFKATVKGLIRPGLISSKLARALKIDIAVVSRSSGSSNVSRNSSY